MFSITEKKIAKDLWETTRIMYLGAHRVKDMEIQTLKAEFQRFIHEGDIINQCLRAQDKQVILNICFFEGIDRRTIYGVEILKSHPQLGP